MKNITKGLLLFGVIALMFSCKKEDKLSVPECDSGAAFCAEINGQYVSSNVVGYDDSSYVDHPYLLYIDLSTSPTNINALYLFLEDVESGDVVSFDTTAINSSVAFAELKDSGLRQLGRDGQIEVFEVSDSSFVAAFNLNFANSQDPNSIVYTIDNANFVLRP